MKTVTAQIGAETWRWEVILDGDQAIVRESRDGAIGFADFGPMPRDYAGPFMDERRELLEEQAPMREKIRRNLES